ncbi:flavin reductase family protein [Paenibacillus sp. CF384]|uniref:flavin reductase family protein n=1 Tax=Paenibacillus sp. CF384 TaxID=1884382 RepID=UPI00089693BB|nr:flavin reductase family protein [Paenibacillus sp. CF384]SDW14272.1 NADH-FMN oxidoreductase RutF, flavin reductase (DIM6/NTAB) family [Paenibacillus sp. CF384]
MKVDPGTLPWRDAYKLLIGSVLPRPIAFVSTVDLQGNSNLAPFSFFTGICAKPMMVCFAPMIRGSDGKKKDTLANIEATKQFVINIVGEQIAAQMNDCATEFPPEIDEFTYTGLTKVPSHTVQPPRVQECDVQLECTLHQIVTLGELPGAGSLVIGQVVCIHVQDELFEGGRINSELLRPIGRMAGQTYTRAISDTFELERK